MKWQARVGKKDGIGGIANEPSDDCKNCSEPIKAEWDGEINLADLKMYDETMAISNRQDYFLRVEIINDKDERISWKDVSFKVLDKGLVRWFQFDEANGSNAYDSVFPKNYLYFDPMPIWLEDSLTQQNLGIDFGKKMTGGGFYAGAHGSEAGITVEVLVKMPEEDFKDKNKVSDWVGSYLVSQNGEFGLTFYWDNVAKVLQYQGVFGLRYFDDVNNLWMDECPVVGNKGFADGSGTFIKSQGVTGVQSGWHHVAIVYDSAVSEEERLKIYIDGIKNNYEKSPDQLNTSCGFPLGVNRIYYQQFEGEQIKTFSDSGYFSGVLSELAVYNKALDGDTIKKIAKDLLDSVK